MKWPLEHFNGKRVVCIGHGAEGLSCRRFLMTHCQLVDFQFIDRTDGVDYLDTLEDIRQEDTVIIKTPGCPGTVVAMPYTTPTQIFFSCVRSLGARTIGVTGTKGKTTTTSLVGKMLDYAGYDCRVLGNIGTPMLDGVDTATTSCVFVVELSSYQLAELGQSPDIAVITNLYHDHLDYHGSVEKYWQAKRNIVRHMNHAGVVVYNPEFPLISEWCAAQCCTAIAIKAEDAPSLAGARLIGDHNRLNALMAMTACRFVGASEDAALSALKEYIPPKHRLEEVRTVRGIVFIDDAIGSEPEATIAGLRALAAERRSIGCVMVGGLDRGYSYHGVVVELVKLQVPTLVLFPDSGAAIRALLPESYSPMILETRSMNEAVMWAATHCPSGTVCLLSTASPSYSLWKNYEEKGRLFQEAVYRLVQ